MDQIYDCFTPKNYNSSNHPKSKFDFHTSGKFEKCQKFDGEKSNFDSNDLVQFCVNESSTPPFSNIGTIGEDQCESIEDDYISLNYQNLQTISNSFKSDNTNRSNIGKRARGRPTKYGKVSKEDIQDHLETTFIKELKHLLGKSKRSDAHTLQVFKYIK